MPWPNRSSRSEYSPGDIVDEKRLVDPVRQIGADIANLVFWNAAGVGITAPKARLVIDPASATALSAGFAWDVNNVYLNTLLANIPWIDSFTVNGVGDYTLVWSALVAAIDGGTTALSFEGGTARPMYPTGSTPPVAVAERNARVDFQLVDPLTMSILIRDKSGAPSSPLDAPFALLGW